MSEVHDIRELLESSSLGTAGAQRLRDRTSLEAGRRIVKLAQLEEEIAAGAWYLLGAVADIYRQAGQTDKADDCLVQLEQQARQVREHRDTTDVPDAGTRSPARSQVARSPMLDREALSVPMRAILAIAAERHMRIDMLCEVLAHLGIRRPDGGLYTIRAVHDAARALPYFSYHEFMITLKRAPEPSPKKQSKWFAAEKGFGFITTDDGSPDIFVHDTVVVESAGYRSLNERERARLKITPGPEVEP